MQNQLLLDCFYIIFYFLAFMHNCVGACMTCESDSPMAMKISFTFMDVLADVSINSRLLSSAYDWASCRDKVSVTAQRRIHACRSRAFLQQLEPLYVRA